jgi:predicted nucleotidyltransferase component of viral defense system
MIPRAVANRFANVLGVDLHIAQQEIVLLYALEALSEGGLLDRLVFKGGTYLRVMVTGDVGRLSEDLDFTNAGLPEDPVDEFRRAFAGESHGVRFGVVEPYRTSRRNWACGVTYSHAWDEGRFRLEISYREAPFLAPRRWKPLPQPYFDELPFELPEIPSLRVEEAIAEKLRAIQERATERDLYDATRYARKGFQEDLVRTLAVGKLWNDHERFEPEAILRTLAAGRPEWPDLERLIGRRRRRDWNREVREASRRFAFLARLTPFERRLQDDGRRHALARELSEHLQAMDRAPTGSPAHAPRGAAPG